MQSKREDKRNRKEPSQQTKEENQAGLRRAIDEVLDEAVSAILVNSVVLESKESWRIASEAENTALNALCHAAKRGNLVEIDQRLKSNRLLINGDRHNIPLFWATLSQDAAAFHHLLAAGASVTIVEDGYNLAQQIALFCQWPLSQRKTILETLAKEGVTVGSFSIALTIKNDDKLISLIESPLLKDTRKNTFFHYAAANGHLPLLKQLHAVYPLLANSGNHARMTPLLFAARNGQLPTVKWLLKKGKAKITEKDRNGWTVISWAARSGHLPVLQWLLSTAGTPRNTIPLCLAAESGNLAMVQWLLEVDFPAWERANALLHAAENGHLAVVQILLKEDVVKIIYRKNDKELQFWAKEAEARGLWLWWIESLWERKTPLLLAAQGGHLVMVQWLLHEDRAQIIKEDIDNDTALLLAALHGHLLMAQWLLQEGGAKIKNYYPGCRWHSGHTLLEAAASGGNNSLVNWLINEYAIYPGPGDGTEIARLLGARHADEQREKAKELRDTFSKSYLKKQLPVVKRALQVGLPIGFPKVLVDIIAEYTQHEGEKQPELLHQSLAQNENLQKALKAHANSRNPLVKWRNLSRELVETITAQQYCTVLTIHTAVEEFLAVHAKKIAGSDLAKVLNNILGQTAYLALPVVQALEPIEQQKGVKPGTFGRREDKPSSAAKRGFFASSTSSSQTTATANLLTLKTLSDPQLNTLKWREDGRGGAMVDFDNRAKAVEIRGLLVKSCPTLTFELREFSSSSFPVVRYSLLATPATAEMLTL